MSDGRVGVPVTVRHIGRCFLRVFVLMVFVVHMKVFVFDAVVRMLVFMMLREMQPDASAHE
jgi:hypothetical protein